jgi:hypothetical protein
MTWTSQTLDNGRLLLVRFNDRREMGRAMMRLQETYENPQVRWDDSVEWIRTVVSRQAVTNGQPYEEYWEGFNVPGHHVLHVISGAKDATAFERWLLRRCQRGVSYVAVWDGTSIKTLIHELSHACYHIHINYELEVEAALEVLRAADREGYLSARETLRIMRYGENILDDEMAAYLVAHPAWVYSRPYSEPLLEARRRLRYCLLRWVRQLRY